MWLLDFIIVLSERELEWSCAQFIRCVTQQASLFRYPYTLPVDDAARFIAYRNTPGFRHHGLSFSPRTVCWIPTFPPCQRSCQSSLPVCVMIDCKAYFVHTHICVCSCTIVRSALSCQLIIILTNVAVLSSIYFQQSIPDCRFNNKVITLLYRKEIQKYFFSAV